MNAHLIIAVSIAAVLAAAIAFSNPLASAVADLVHRAAYGH